MTDQKRTIIGACEYSILTLQQLKKDLQDLGVVNKKLNWAVGGIIATLTSNLLQTCDQVLQESIAEGKPDAKQDLMEIKNRFSKFIDSMVGHE